MLAGTHLTQCCTAMLLCFLLKGACIELSSLYRPGQYPCSCCVWVAHVLHGKPRRLQGGSQLCNLALQSFLWPKKGGCSSGKAPETDQARTAAASPGCPEMELSKSALWRLKVHCFGNWPSSMHSRKNLLKRAVQDCVYCLHFKVWSTITVK